jgi:hypothetical protein
MAILPRSWPQRKGESVRQLPVWGGRGAPLLPRVLREAWASERLPAWIGSDLRLGDSLEVSNLDSRSVSGTGAPDRVLRYITLLVNTRRDSIRTLPSVGQPWPSILSFAEIPWRRRTRNCLIRHRLHQRLSDLPYLTFGELLDKRSMGMVSILDFACTLEAAVDVAQRTSTGDQQTPDAEVSAALVRALEEPWADWISEKDPRFEGLLPPGTGTIAERIDQLTSDPEANPQELRTLSASLDDIRARVRELEAQPLDVAAMRFLELVAGVSGERLRALAARLHWHGESEPKTLEDAGRMVGITRERIRQLEARFKGRLPSHPVLLPSLDAALTLLASHAPLEATSGSRLLERQKLTRNEFHPASLIAIAKTCGRNPIIQVQQMLGKTMVVDQPAAARAEKVVAIAQRQTQACGATNVTEVAAEIANAENVDISEEETRELLTKYSTAEFFDNSWFWFPDRLIDGVSNISRKILSVTSPIEAGLVREGIRRVFQFRQSIARKKGRLLAVPPRSVLLAYYRAHPDFVVIIENSVRPTRPLDYRVELGGIDQVVVDVIRSAPSSVLDRAGLAEACTERGVNLNSLWTMTSYSPVLQNLGGGLWTLRGNRVDPAAIEALRRSNRQRPRLQRVVDHGWTPEGYLWIATRLPTQFQNKVFGIPGAVKKWIADRDFEAFAEDGSACGRIRIYDYGTSAGYTPFLSRAGADEGDLMLARFDIVQNKVHLSLITDEQLEDLSPEL